MLFFPFLVFVFIRFAFFQNHISRKEDDRDTTERSITTLYDSVARSWIEDDRASHAARLLTILAPRAKR